MAHPSQSGVRIHVCLPSWSELSASALKKIEPSATSMPLIFEPICNGLNETVIRQDFQSGLGKVPMVSEGSLVYLLLPRWLLWLSASELTSMFIAPRSSPTRPPLCSPTSPTRQ